MSDRRKLGLHVVLLVAIFGLVYFPYLDNAPFYDKGEPREALAVQDILQRGEWLFPLKRARAIPSKPPLFHWSAALTARMTDRFDELTIRFPSAFYAASGVIVVYLFGRRLFGPGSAFLGAAALATTSVYADQALSARVDMTLTFFVTATLVLFYSLHRGFLTAAAWRYLFYVLLGVGTLAKGPLGLLLPGVVVAVFLALKRRWHEMREWIVHPGALLTVVLAAGWYVAAVGQGGEGFVERQLLSENLERFIGGSGHSHPFFYYLPYLFSHGLPWSLLYPFMLWDSFRRFSLARDEALFLQTWFLVMFIFFSASVGKRPVYLLPLYPALSLLLGAWLYDAAAACSVRRRALYRILAGVFGLIALALLSVLAGTIWNHESAWLFNPIETLLKPKDRANMEAVTDSLKEYGWRFTATALVTAALILSLARCLWDGRLRPAAHRLLLVSIATAFITRAVVVPEMAEARSYRDFMREAAQRIGPEATVYLFGEFNSDSLVFYHGGVISRLKLPLKWVASRIGSGNEYLILPEDTWLQLANLEPNVPPPLLRSEGKGPEGDAPLVLVQANLH